MGNFVERISDFSSSLVGNTWNWFMLLDREEWILVLILITACGMLCLFGFGSRSKY